MDLYINDYRIGFIQIKGTKFMFVPEGGLVGGTYNHSMDRL